MDNNQETFRFELDESLYFEKGQEVDEMTGISLDPDISIQPFGDYIEIRGVIELSGTYRQDTSLRNEDEEELGFEDYHSKRFVEEVISLDDQLSEFSHRFPVEISVPAHRIDDMEDITVAVESFDYEIPDQNQLKLTSIVEIHGISEVVENSYETEKQEDPALSLRGEESFAFDIKMDKTKPEEEKEINLPPQSSDLSESYDQNSLKTEDTSSPEKEREKNKKSQTLAEFFGSEQKKDSEEEGFTSEAESSETSDDETTVVEYTETAYKADSYESSSSPEDVRYLADMFSRDDEETYAKMRLCIVQDNDTLESIAERYDTPAHQLLKRNHLTEEGLQEGQLLYIPVKNKP
ncbi:stage VI sporulation protein D [Lentibacillus persicus]|uniref:Stage VI sporulation protein D n=1 Tax=Lentibacillus persicus TaxID=640948 RepID=A0A1I1TIG6_9BACI|nr:stage VI sporulation protein D [Lentibacillus persicus]SFD58404.1 stage VI sporulation protein D [Lentibacillus persicus]